MASPGVETFLANLEKSNLLAADVLQPVRDEAERGGMSLAVESFAPKLVERGLLTPWQAAELAAGRTSFFLGKYKLLGELGRGGMGAVYKAIHSRLGRVVALKVMAPKLVSDEQAVARFRREIEAAAALNHPHVVAAFDADHVEGTHFLVMEYVEGESLADLLKRQNRLPVTTACEYIRQAALGLAHAHERGMAHRDIKPANLLLTRTADGQPLVKILDMGLARFTSERREDSDLTSTGQVMGTPDYIAPEQARSTKSADIRSDIYSLGCTLFRCLTGQLPFEGESVVEKLMARAMGDAPRLRQYLPEAPAPLEAVVSRMLARDPAARYQTPTEVAAALGTLVTLNLAGLASTATSHAKSQVPPAASRDPGVDQFLQQLIHERELEDSGETVADGVRTQIAMPGGTARNKGRLVASMEERRRADRRRIVQAVTGSLLLTAAAITACVWWVTGHTHLIFDWPADERAGAQVEVDGYQLSIPERAEIHVPAGRAGRRKLRLVRSGYETIETTIEFARGETRTFRPEWKPTAATIRRLQLAELESKAQSLLKQCAGRLPPADDAELQSLRQRFAELRSTFRLTRDQPRFDTLWRRLPFPADYLKMETRPDESLALDPLAISPPPNELVAAWGDARLKAPLLGHSLSVSPDGRLAATRSSDQTLYVWDLQKGRLHVPPIAQFECWGFPQFSPDGKFLHYVADGIMIWSLDDRRVVKSLPLSSNRAADAFTWIPGRSVVAWSDLQAVQLWDFENGKSQESLGFPLDDAEEVICALAASRDGRLLAAGTSQGKIRIWDVATRESFDLPKVDGQTYSLAFSPDGGQLAAGIHISICLWDLATRELRYAKRAPLNYGLNSLSWRPDGKILAANMGTGDVALWNVAEGAVQSQLHTRGHHNTVAAFSHEGRRLVTVGGDGIIQVWDADSLEELLPTGPPLTSAAVDPLGEWVALGTGDNRIEIHDLASGALREEIALPFFASQLCVSPDRKFIGVIAAPPVFRLHVIPLDGQHEVRELREMESAMSLAFTPDARLLVASTWGGGVAGWSTADFSLKFKALPVDPHWPAVGAVLAVSPDSHKLIMVGGSPAGGVLAAVHLPEGKKLYIAPAIAITNSVTIAGDAERAITGAGPYISLVDLAQGKARETVTIPGLHGDLVNGLNSSPDGERIVAALSNSKLWILSADSLNAFGEFDLGNRMLAPQQALYTPDGRHVVTLNANGTVCVWRLTEWTGKNEQ